MGEMDKMAQQIKTLLYLLVDPGGRELLAGIVKVQTSKVRKAAWVGRAEIRCGSVIVKDEDVTRWDHLDGKEVTMYLVDDLTSPQGRRIE